MSDETYTIRLFGGDADTIPNRVMKIGKKPRYDPAKSDAFIRQRRNLLLACVVLYLAVVYGLEIDAINLLGTGLKFNSDIDVGNWSAFFVAYFLLRFYQFYKALNVFSFQNTIEEEELKHNRAVIAYLFFEQMHTTIKNNITLETEDINPFPIEKIQNPDPEMAQYFTVEYDDGFDKQLKYIGLDVKQVKRTKKNIFWSVVKSSPYITEFVVPAVIATFLLGYYIGNIINGI